MKRYDIQLLPKNFFTGGSFYTKGGGGDWEGEGGGVVEEEEEEDKMKKIANHLCAIVLKDLRATCHLSLVDNCGIAQVEQRRHLKQKHAHITL